MALTPGTRLGVYEITGPIGVGGMGEVYRARDSRLDRDVAVKVLPSSFAEDPDRLRRFEQEARTTGMLNHPNVLALYDVGTHEGAPYLVTELLEGLTLRQELPVSRRKALDYARQIATGLAAAHAKGVTHRDLKPENVFVTADGRVKILDFGLAKVTAPIPDSMATRTVATTPGMALGTVGYMSPEQALGKPADHRSDIFSFGAVLYELLSGTRAFCAPSGIETLNAILKADPPPLADAVLERLVRRCLEKSPEQRFQSASDLAFDLETLSGDSTNAGSAVRPAPSWTRMDRVVAPAAVLAAVVFAGLWWQARQDTRPEWTAVRLGGPEIAMVPRVSPNGQMLAFVAMVEGLSQVAVMNPDSGNWTVLTHDRTNGPVDNLSWSREGDKIFFDRKLETPRGVYSVPALGGEEQLVLEEAVSPEVVPDGSLLLVRINADRKFQLHHFWPATGRLEPLAVETSGVVRVFPDGKEAAFSGRPLVSSKPEPPFGYYAVNLASGHTRRLASDVKLPGRGLAISPKGDSVLVTGRTGDLVKLIEVARDGKGTGRTVLDVSGDLQNLDMFQNGSIYLDQFERPSDILRIASTGGPPERLASVPVGGLPIQIPNGRVLFSSFLSGRSKVLVARPGKDPVPFVQTEEDTGGAVALGEKEIVLGAFRVGDATSGTIVVASAVDGRIVRRLEATKGHLVACAAASPDGKTVYYCESGDIWAIPAVGGPPRKLTTGDAVAPDPNGQDLIVMRREKDAVHLFRVSLSGGAEQPIPFLTDMRLRGNFASNAVGRDGRILVDVESLDSWWDEVGILDPRTGKVERLAIPYSGDIWAPGWTPDGRILAQAARMQAGLWRFRKAGK